MSGRLALWLVPLVAVVLAASLPGHLRRATLPWLLAGSAALTVVTGPALRDGVSLLGERIVLQEVEPVLVELVARSQPGDVVLVDRSARPAFDLYARELDGLRSDGLLGFREPSPAVRRRAGARRRGLRRGARLDRLHAPDRWRRLPAVARRDAAAGRCRGGPAGRVEAPGAAAYLYVPRADPSPVPDRRLRPLPRLEPT
jgi:hypothetical protein